MGIVTSIPADWFNHALDGQHKAVVGFHFLTEEARSTTNEFSPVVPFDDDHVSVQVLIRPFQAFRTLESHQDVGLDEAHQGVVVLLHA